MNNFIWIIALEYLYFWAVIMLSILIHEVGHLLVALWCGVPVETFSIGFGKPVIWKRKWKGITWQVTPWLLGGYTSLYGETNIKKKKGFLAQRWSKKVAILLAGVTMNFILACICYLIMYHSIITGLKIDFALMGMFFTKDFTIVYDLLVSNNFHPLLVQISLINIFCVITNIFPFPALDGGLIWLAWCEKLFKRKKDYEIFSNRINKFGFWFLMLGQIVLIGYLIIRR